MPRSADRNYALRELEKRPLGTRKIVSKVYSNGSDLCVDLKCEECGNTFSIVVSTILRGLSSNCRCQRRVKYRAPQAYVLQQRYSALQQRCENPKSQSWPNYGGRGIQNKFKTPEAFVEYMLKHCYHPTYKGTEIDRIDNDGHYAPGNIRLVTRTENSQNKRSNVKIRYKRKIITAQAAARELKNDYPGCTMTLSKVAHLLRNGVDWKDLRQRKGRGPYKKRSSTT